MRNAYKADNNTVTLRSPKYSFELKTVWSKIIFPKISNLGSLKAAATQKGAQGNPP
jgi:hypothetical protein